MDSNRVRAGRHGLTRIFTPTFLTVWFANLLFFTNLSSFYLLPLYVKSLGGSEAAIGLIMGAFNAVAIFGQPLVGEWVDRAGRRPFMVTGAALMVVATFTFAFVDSFLLLFALRMLQGVAHSAFFIANFTFIAELVPVDRRGQAMGLFGISGLVATALAPLAGEQLIRGLGYRAFFFAGTTVALLSLLVTLRVRIPALTAPRVAAERLTLFERLYEMTRLPMLIALTFGLGSGTVFIFLPPFAQSLGMKNLGLFYTAYAGAALLVRTLGGGLIDRLGRRQVIVPGMLMQVVGVSLLALFVFVAPLVSVSPLSVFFLSGFLTGGAHGFLYPALSALLVDETPEARRGRAVGIFSSCVLLGNTVGAVLSGYIASGLGYGVMFTFLTAVLLGGFVLSLRLKP